jgi:RNA recognition motif-containing protein
VRVALLIDPGSILRVQDLSHLENLVGKRLYIGNLPSSVSSSELRDWFTPFGTVQSAEVVTDNNTGRSKGFGFVEMDSEAQAQAAILGLNDLEHEGRWLIVSEAKPGAVGTIPIVQDNSGGSGQRY